MLELSSLTAKAERQYSLVFGNALEKRDEAGAARCSRTSGHLISNGIENEP
jgi:hypothetical protein